MSPAVPLFDAADPNSRVFPHRRVELPRREGELDLGHAPEEIRVLTNVAPEWITAARDAGIDPDLSDDQVGDIVFHALVAVTSSPAWVADQPIWQDDYPGIPVPADPAALLAAADTGRRIANLFDTVMPVPGVTAGKIIPELAVIAVPDPAPTDTALTIGRFGVAGGNWKANAERLLWTTKQGDLGWNGVPEHVWTFRVAGFQVLPKYLSYRVGQPLDASAREDITHLCRRIAALRALEADADQHYLNALAKTLTLPPQAT